MPRPPGSVLITPQYHKYFTTPKEEQSVIDTRPLNKDRAEPTGWCVGAAPEAAAAASHQHSVMTDVQRTELRQTPKLFTSSLSVAPHKDGLISPWFSLCIMLLYSNCICSEWTLTLPHISFFCAAPTSFYCFITGIVLEFSLIHCSSRTHPTNINSKTRGFVHRAPDSTLPLQRESSCSGSFITGWIQDGLTMGRFR